MLGHRLLGHGLPGRTSAGGCKSASKTGKMVAGKKLPIPLGLSSVGDWPAGRAGEDAEKLAGLCSTKEENNGSGRG